MGLFSKVKEAAAPETPANPPSELRQLKENPPVKSGGKSAGDVYRDLLARCEALSLPEEWLRARLREQGKELMTTSTGQLITVKDWSFSEINKISNALLELENKVSEMTEGNDPKKNTRAPRKPRAKTATETPELDAIMQWATAAGLDGALVYAQWGGEKDYGKLKDKLAAIIKAKTNQETGEISKTTTEGLQAAAAELGRDLDDNRGVHGGQQVSSTPREGSAKTANGAIPDPEVQEMLDEVRRKVGIPIGEPNQLTKEMVEGILRQRMLLLQELSYITARYYALRESIGNKITALESAWKVPLNQYYTANKPEGKVKSINLMYGKLGTRDKALSVAIDKENQHYLWELVKSLPPEEKERLHVTPIEGFNWDWDVYKKEQIEAAKEAGTTPRIPGTIVTPAEADVFYIGPAADGIIEKAKKGEILE